MKRILVVLILLCICSFSSLAQVEQNKRATKLSKLTTLELSNAFPDTIQISGIVSESKKGACGKKCRGGYIEVELQQKVEGYNFQNIYVITGCHEIKKGTTVNYRVKQLKGNEPECMYRKHYRPSKKVKQPFYRILQVNPS